MARMTDPRDQFTLGCCWTTWSPTQFRGATSTPAVQTVIDHADSRAGMPGITRHFLRRKDNALLVETNDDSDESGLCKVDTSEFGEAGGGLKGLLGVRLPGRSTWKKALCFAQAAGSNKRLRT